MKVLNRFAVILSKVMEVLHWLAAVSMVVLLVGSLAFRKPLEALLSENIRLFGGTLSTCGFEIAVADGDTVNMTAVTLFAAAGILLLPLMAMVFRNVYLILRTVQGQTWFSEGSTPFQTNVTRMLREIGIFSIAVPVVGLVMSAVARGVIGYETAEISVSLNTLVMGLLILCLSQAFAYGAELQQDVDGLL